MHDISALVQRMIDTVTAHNLGAPGAYRRWTLPRHAPSSDRNEPLPASSRADETAPNPYGCADAANILYTLGYFPRDPFERQGWVSALQALQDQHSGLFNEATHHPIHTTAHCLAALELFDAGPAHPVTALLEYRDPLRLEVFLEALNWEDAPWSESHRGAGLYVALVLTGQVGPAWEDAYFDWLWNETDAETGFLRRLRIQPVQHGQTLSIFPHLAGTFHYFFNHVYARRPFRYPAAAVETCLRIWREKLYPLAAAVGFAEIDWVYCLTRSLRQSGHRFAEARAALVEFANQYVPYMQSLDGRHAGFDDLHALFGACCCLAELQQAVPGLIRSPRPLKLVLDRRPFI